MKALPRRKGNLTAFILFKPTVATSMKALPRRKGNGTSGRYGRYPPQTSMKALPRRKGNLCFEEAANLARGTSMKALPRRKGNVEMPAIMPIVETNLNESPSQKEGKWPPETSPQRCGRNGYHARTSRQANTKSIPKPAYTRPNIRDKPKHHASDTPYLRHVPGSRANKDPLRILSWSIRRGSLLYKLFGAAHAARFTLCNSPCRISQRQAAATQIRRACPHEPTQSNETPHGNTSSDNHQPASPQ